MQTAQLSLSSSAEKLMLFPWPLLLVALSAVLVSTIQKDGEKKGEHAPEKTTRHHKKALDLKQTNI